MPIHLKPDQEARDPAFASFVRDVYALVEEERRPVALTEAIRSRMGDLLGDWRMPDPRFMAMQPGQPYGSFLLYRAPESRFVVIIDTFEGNQTTRVHNHRTWAVVGLVEGRERESRYTAPPGLRGAPVMIDETITEAGDIITMLEPDFHALTTTPGVNSVSFHVYGADVGMIPRLCWDPGGFYREFRQGYSNDVVGLDPYFDSGTVVGSVAGRVGVQV